MKTYIKQLTKRGLLGILIGLAMGYTALLIITFAEGGLAIKAPVLMYHYLIAAGVGFWMAVITVVYEVEEWSLMRQTITHGLLTLPYVPIAFVVGWAPQGFFGRVLFVLAYIAAYVIIWLSFKSYWTKRAKELTRGLIKMKLDETQ